MIDILKMHAERVKGMFAPFSVHDERYITLCLCGEAGELANLIKKRWRGDKVSIESIRDEIADIRVFVELIAACFDIAGPKLDARVQDKLERVLERWK